MWYRGMCHKCGFRVLVAHWPTIGEALHDHERHTHPEIFRELTPEDTARIALNSQRFERRSQAASR